ncbi:NUDIX domain-containing protein [Streptomyces populi]
MSNGSLRDASVVVARDENDLVALLSAGLPTHDGVYLFLRGGRREDGGGPLECARRERREEAGVSAESWRPLGSHAITLKSPARVHLFEARHLPLGAREPTAREQDFQLMWWPMQEALHALREERFLLPAGPLALLMAEHRSSRR